MVENLARGFLEALAGGDAEVATALAHPELELRLPTAPRGVPRRIGRAELAGMVANIGRTWTDVSLRVERVDAFATDPARGVAQFGVTATNRDGGTYRNDYLAVFECADGLVRRWTEYYDPAPMVAALDALRAHVRAGR